MAVDLVGFRSYLARGGRKSSSVTAYLVLLEVYERQFPELDFPSANLFIDSLFKKKRKSSYINRFIDIAHLYGKFVNDEALQKIPYVKERIPRKSTMSDEEIEAFLNLPPTTITRTYASGKVVTRYQHEENYNKFTMFWKICAFTGCRMGEAAHLTVNDVSFSNGTLTFRDTKTNDDRVIPIPPNIRDDLLSYVEKVKGEYLFPSARGGNTRGFGQVFDPQDWGRSFKMRVERLGIKRPNLSPYSLRHSFITQTLDGSNLFDAMALYGHKNPKTTMNYYHSSLERTKKVLANHSLIRLQVSPQEVMKAITEALKTFHLDKDKRFTYSLVEENNRLKFELEIEEE